MNNLTKEIDETVDKLKSLMTENSVRGLAWGLNLRFDGRTMHFLLEKNYNEKIIFNLQELAELRDTLNQMEILKDVEGV